MKIGILSDTHDNLPQIHRAVKFFNRQKVDLVLHAGDYVAPFSIACLKSLSSEWCGVFGNNDGEKEGLSKASEGKIKEGPLRIPVSGKRITVVHDLSGITLTKEKADVLIYGHTHKAEIMDREGVLLVNPGECGGWLYGLSTVALLDLVKLTARIHKI